MARASGQGMKAKDWVGRRIFSITKGRRGLVYEANRRGKATYLWVLYDGPGGLIDCLFSDEVKIEA